MRLRCRSVHNFGTCVWRTAAQCQIPIFLRRYTFFFGSRHFGALLRICSLPARWPPRRGALDMCGTARIFCLEHNICIKNTSTSHGRSTASAQHLRLLPSHFFIASGWKEPTKSWTSEIQEIWNRGHTYSNSYIVLNFDTNESFTKLLRSTYFGLCQGPQIYTVEKLIILPA